MITSFLFLRRSLRLLALITAAATTMTTTKLTVRVEAMPAVFQGSNWMLGHATFYGDTSAQSTMGGACGYTNQYGTSTAALSTVLFNNGFACGQCFQLQCSGSSGCCQSNPTVTITATNLCPPNPSQSNDNGGWCNPPLAHFDMALDAFSSIVCNTVVGIVPVMYRRVPCQRSGGIVFSTKGNGYWLLVFVSNVGGPGDISAMSAMGGESGGNWLSMSQNWGASWQLFASLGGQCVSFEVTSYSDQQTLTLQEVFPTNWYVGAEYQSAVNFQSGGSSSGPAPQAPAPATNAPALPPPPPPQAPSRPPQRAPYRPPRRAPTRPHRRAPAPRRRSHKRKRH